MIRFLQYLNAAGRPVVSPFCTICGELARIYVTGGVHRVAVKCGCPR